MPHVRLQQTAGDSYVVSNFGVSSQVFAKNGSPSYWSTEKFSKALASAPDIVIIELGTNDSKYFTNSCISDGSEIWNYNFGLYSTDSLYADYEALIDTFSHVNTLPTIYATLQPYSNNCSWAIMDSAIVNHINPIILATAIKKGTHVIDLHALFNTPEWYLSDSVHPNALGAQKLASIIFDFITKEPLQISQNGHTLKAPAGYAFQWYKDNQMLNGEISQTLNINETGLYKVSVKIESDNDSRLVSNTLEVKNLDDIIESGSTNDSILETPEPISFSNKVLQQGITFNEKSNTLIVINQGIVDIFDMLGHKVATFKNKREISLHDFSKGHYIVRHKNFSLPILIP